MSGRHWLFRIKDILDALSKVETYVQDMTYEQWVMDTKTIDAVIRNLEIIGEAATHVPADIIILHPGIPWRLMKAMRNVLIHEYFGVDVEVLWKTVIEDLPGLKFQLDQICWDE